VLHSNAFHESASEQMKRKIATVERTPTWPLPIGTNAGAVEALDEVPWEKEHELPLVQLPAAKKRQGAAIWLFSVDRIQINPKMSHKNKLK
jgi:hypothetical protein